MSSPTSGSSRTLRTLPSRFLDPPSSPPPTSPLPLPPVSPSPISSIRSHRVTSRPPRPQISLPNLRPARVDSLEFGQRQLVSAVNLPLANSQLQSPFATPVRGSVQSHTQSLSPDLDPMGTGRSAVDGSGEDSLTQLNSERIWWSPAVTDVSDIDTMLATWMSDDLVPRIPPKSRKRKSNKPPRKAVARSALYIPHGNALTPSQSDERLIRSCTLNTMPPLLQDEPITSLPPWPNTRANELNPLDRFRDHLGTCKETGSVVQSTAMGHLTPFIREKRESLAQTSEQHISFCAVTNLEESPQYADAVSTNSRLIGVDSVSEAAPQAWHRRYRRQLWIVATVLVVLGATSGILAGILWKLSQSHYHSQ